jgi:hypothetical protein
MFQWERRGLVVVVVVVVVVVPVNGDRTDLWNVGALNNTRRHDPEDLELTVHRCENFKRRIRINKFVELRT